MKEVEDVLAEVAKENIVDTEAVENEQEQDDEEDDDEDDDGKMDL
jgi:hypothetical protein